MLQCVVFLTAVGSRSTYSARSYLPAPIIPVDILCVVHRHEIEDEITNNAYSALKFYYV